MITRPRPALLLPALFAAAGIAGLALAALGGRDGGRLYEDEREFAAAAAHLLRHGVLAFSPPTGTPPAPSAFREPAYPALVALAWRIAGTTAPSGSAEIERLPEDPRAWRPLRALNSALLALAAAAAAIGVGRLAGPLGGGLAFALVASSPALHATSTQLMSENLAAAHLGLAGLGLLALARGGRRARLGALLVLGLLPLTRAEGVLLLPVALLVDWRAGTTRPAAARRRAAGLLALGLLLPSALWLARNSLRLGHPVLSDRGGLALAVRAELDSEVARFGARSAALAWTPLESARRAARSASPPASWLDYRPTGPGNFYLRTLRRWQEERSRTGADPLAVDAEFGRAALARFARAPWRHARAAAAVAVRGLFAEVSPAWAWPFDLTFALGLLLAAGMLLATAGAVRRRELPTLVFLAPAWLLFGFHVAATELLPRYAVPLLPLAWSALALVLVRVRPGTARGARPPGRRTMGQWASEWNRSRGRFRPGTGTGSRTDARSVTSAPASAGCARGSAASASCAPPTRRARSCSPPTAARPGSASIRSRRSRSTTSCPAPRSSRSAPRAAISRAASARTGTSRSHASGTGSPTTPTRTQSRARPRRSAAARWRSPTTIPPSSSSTRSTSPTPAARAASTRWR